ncbi:MAG TPA: twin-arginine translocation signal domain-containing protein [Candidatus Saccharimonadales bacterium]|nr:twin-arginine translocation signal domain-containing protein [Candidatus Saccharimonadales bacterium]
MKVQTEMQALLQKKMDRRDFIKHVGIGFVALLGLSAVLRALSSMNGTSKSTVGYSGGVYGGRDASTNQSKQG